MPNSSLQQIVVESTLNDRRTVSALVDPGSNLSYIDQDLVYELQLTLEPLEQPLSIVNFDGSTTERGIVWDRVKTDLRLGHLTFGDTIFHVTFLDPNLPLVLGFDFAQANNMNISWRDLGISFTHLRSSSVTMEPPIDYRPDWLDEVDYEAPDLTKVKELVHEDYHEFLDFSKEKVSNRRLDPQGECENNP
ncbi:hypothetical protein MNV49_003043 [Pseudohyphozyma bogoriensis]|nr:hypothetical protein MNV49_003043 [Pseudohyphozyma bogoriensis]